MGEINVTTAVSPMDVELKETKFSFNVLQLIKTAQNEHGVRHHDYTRYRRYCTARLRRLYKSLKFTHGRGKYVRRQIVVANVTDTRFLHILLYSAERAWSYAMAIKQTTNGPNSRQRFHLVGRLSKAVKWADAFSHACAEKADPKTSLEATAYVAYMKGSYLVEREQHWDTALRNFESARVIYEELGKYGSVENQVLCRQRVEDEIDPNIRYCSYKMGQSKMDGTELLKLSRQEGPAFDLLKAKLEAVMSEARSQQAVSMTELSWLGRKFAIDNAKIRSCIVKGQQLEKELGASITTLSAEKKLSVFDKIFSSYQDARRHIREDLAAAGSADGVKDNLNGLDKAVSCILLQQTMNRNQLLVAMSKNRFSKQQQHLPKEEKNDKLTKPQELVRLYDLLIQNSTDLSDLVTSGREQNVEETMFAMELAARKFVFQAERCFYLAHVHLAAAKYAQSYLLYRRACEYAEIGLKDYQQQKTQQQALFEHQDAMEELERLSRESKIQSCLVHALGISEASKTERSLQNGISKISFDDLKTKKTGFLIDRADNYEAMVALPGYKEPPRILQLPPAFQAVACKPIVLDTAINAIVFPSLEAHLKKEDKKKSFFGFWRS
ncbi:hypothetical protein GOP47_0010662 [Adiantum capillus-veneris]|uniref:Signal recognition particle subunit SRP68 n=1 Tax=Adiantum capillus-veneris TaxID=13818 RepID=A0A9D4UVI8_ADICA|nr:hypothetical protein GOP47_0010662 [Adiantum capillus-veneris]